MPQVGGVSARGVAGSPEVVAEQAPGFGMVGLQRHGTSQRRDRLVAAADAGARARQQEFGRRVVRHDLQNLPGLLGRERSFPLELSAGEQQRVGIARAVITKPPVLIADEPTGNLDPDLALEVMNLFQRFNAVGVTVLVATHDVHLLERFRVRRLHIEHGHLASVPHGRA